MSARLLSFALVALALAAGPVAAQLAVRDVTIAPDSFLTDSSIHVRYAIVNGSSRDVAFRTAIQIVDNRGNVLYASPWSSGNLVMGGHDEWSWDGPYVSGLLQAREAGRLIVNVWAEQAGRQHIVARRTLVRLEGAAGSLFACRDCGESSRPAQVGEIRDEDRLRPGIAARRDGR